MQTYEIPLVAAACSGLVMVGGGIALLWKGAIKLEVASGDPAVRIELLRQLAFSTRVPALGFFFIGGMFCWMSLWFSEASGRPLVIKARTVGDYPGFFADARPAANSRLGGNADVVTAAQNVVMTAHAASDQVEVEFGAAGYDTVKHIVSWPCVPNCSFDVKLSQRVPKPLSTSIEQ